MTRKRQKPNEAKLRPPASSGETLPVQFVPVDRIDPCPTNPASRNIDELFRVVENACREVM